MRLPRSVPAAGFFAVLLLWTLLPRSLAAQDGSPGGLVAQGDALLAEGRLGEARKAYERALSGDETLTAASIGLARVALEEGQWHEAARQVEQVLAREPDHMEARYYRAISHREVAKYRGLLDRRHWSQAEEQFEWILARDSLYRDVLYQYALLRRNAGDYTGAVVLGSAQYRLRPEQEEARQGLFRLYHTYLNHTPPKEALAWLRERSGPYPEFFAGEALRRQGALQAADSVFAGVLQRPALLPRQPILLARARVAYALGQAERGQALVEQAIREIASPAEAALVLEDFKYLLTDAELAQYRTLRDPAAFQAFFAGFWTRRDPLPAGKLNQRLAEHYRRLLKAEQEYVFDGLRSWHNDPDKLRELNYPRVYLLNEEFNDKGLIYIRHGEPAERIITVAGEVDFFRSQTRSTGISGLPKDQSLDAGWVPNESWRYLNPKMDFHFVVDEGAGLSNWRLTPVVLNRHMLEDREHWGGIYVRLASLARTLETRREELARAMPEESQQLQEPSPSRDSDENRGQSEDAASAVVAEPARSDPREQELATGSQVLDLITYRDEMVEESQEFIELGLSTDRHTWAGEVEPLEVPYLLAAFRGEDGQTNLEIHFALPIGRLTREIGMDVRTVDVEVACALFGLDWQPVAEEAQVKQLPPVPDVESAALDFCRLVVPPDSYQVAFHNRPVQTKRLSGYKFGHRVPAFTADALALSDLLPAYAIQPAIGPGRFSRGELYIRANPFLRFSVQEPVFLYFEVYNLTFDAQDQTQYSVEYTLTPVKARRRVLGLFGGGDAAALSLRADRTGTERSPREYAEIDVSRVDPGAYVLTVKVTNELTGEAAVSSRPIELTK